MEGSFATIALKILSVILIMFGALCLVSTSLLTEIITAIGVLQYCVWPRFTVDDEES